MFDTCYNTSGPMTMLDKFDLLRLLQAVSGALRAQWDRELGAQIPELNAAGAAIILQLGRSGGASQIRLSRLLGPRQVTVSRLLDSLERRGWVHREAMPTNRRTWAARLTDDGKRVLFAIHIAQRAFVDRIFTAPDADRSAIPAFCLPTRAGGQTGGREPPRPAGNMASRLTMSGVSHRSSYAEPA